MSALRFSVPGSTNTFDREHKNGPPEGGPFQRNSSYFSVQVLICLYALYSVVAGARSVITIVIGCDDNTFATTLPDFNTLYVPSFVEVFEASPRGRSPCTNSTNRTRGVAISPDGVTTALFKMIDFPGCAISEVFANFGEVDGVFGFKSGVTEFEAAEASEVPSAFVAVAVNVYAVPFVKPVTSHDVAGTVTVHDFESGELVTVYVTGVPPVVGATTVTVAAPVPATAVGAPGVPGFEEVGSGDGEGAAPIVRVALPTVMVPRADIPKVS